MIVLKIPFDLGIIDAERRGTRLAPDLLASNLASKHPNLQFIDVPVFDDFTATSDSICADAVSALKNAQETGEKVLAIGGDHSITFSLASAFKEIYPNSCLIILDAHSDCEPDFIPPSHEGVTRALASTCFSPKDILLIGYRKARTKEEKEFIQKHGIQYIESKDINQDTIKRVQDFIKPFDSAYLSIDIDVFDPKDAPGTGWPEVGGPAKEVLLNLIKELAKSDKLKSVDLVEASPPLDKGDKTASTAIELLELFTTPKG